MDLFYDSVELRKLCCGVRKVEPLERALTGLDAWITGLRPDQSVTRAGVRAVEIDQVHGGRIKLNPLVPFLRLFREPILRGELPTWQTYAAATAWVST